jgi:FixJ family two-component response regulator
MCLEATVYVVDDDVDLGASVSRLLRRHHYLSEAFSSPGGLLDAYRSGKAHCVITDIMMDDLDGFQFSHRLRLLDPSAAIIFMTAWPTVASAVDSVRRYRGHDYLEKPIDEDRLLAAVAEGVSWSEARRATFSRTATLTLRERQVFDLLVQGHTNKVIAGYLGLSPKTVEDHRAAVLSKTGAYNIASLIELARADRASSV